MRGSGHKIINYRKFQCVIKFISRCLCRTECFLVGSTEGLKADLEAGYKDLEEV